MALAISGIPMLTGDEALAFREKESRIVTTQYPYRKLLVNKA